MTSTIKYCYLTQVQMKWKPQQCNKSISHIKCFYFIFNSTDILKYKSNVECCSRSVKTKTIVNNGQL